MTNRSPAPTPPTSSALKDPMTSSSEIMLLSFDPALLVSEGAFNPQTFVASCLESRAPSLPALHADLEVCSLPVLYVPSHHVCFVFVQRYGEYLRKQLVDLINR